MALGGELALNVLWQLDRNNVSVSFSFSALFVIVFLVFFILIVGFIVIIAAAVVAVGLLF